MIDSFLRAFATAFGIGAGFLVLILVAGLIDRLATKAAARTRRSLVQRTLGRRQNRFAYTAKCPSRGVCGLSEDICKCTD